MSVSLAEALEKVELEPGRTYRCRVRGMCVELYVFPEPDETSALVPNGIPQAEDDQ